MFSKHPTYNFYHHLNMDKFIHNDSARAPTARENVIPRGV